MWWQIIILTAINTFWLFYLAGDIPGTVDHRRRNESPAKRPSKRGATGGLLHLTKLLRRSQGRSDGE